MGVSRRCFVSYAAIVGFLSFKPTAPRAYAQGDQRYGLIGRINATPGDADRLADILFEGMQGMAGCESYIVAKDSADSDSLWITEVWDSPASHAASLEMESVQQAISRGRPLIAGFGERFETKPVGGIGLD